MRDHAGGGESHGSVNVDQGLATLDEGVDELVGNETMGAFMAAVMAEGFGQEVGLPPSGRGIALDHLRGARKAAAIFLRGRLRTDDDGATEARRVGLVETHAVSVIAGALPTLLRPTPPNGHAHGVATIGPE